MVLNLAFTVEMVDVLAILAAAIVVSSVTYVLLKVFKAV